MMILYINCFASFTSTRRRIIRNAHSSRCTRWVSNIHLKWYFALCCWLFDYCDYCFWWWLLLIWFENIFDDLMLCAYYFHFFYFLWLIYVLIKPTSIHVISRRCYAQPGHQYMWKYCQEENSNYFISLSLGIRQIFLTVCILLLEREM